MYQSAAATTMTAAAMATMATVEAATITPPCYPGVFGVETTPRAERLALRQEPPQVWRACRGRRGEQAAEEEARKPIRRGGAEDSRDSGAA
jgi:hypothetical protein